MKNVMVLNGVYLDRIVYTLLTFIINPLKYRYIMLYINLYFIKPENTYVLVGSFQYGPLEPGWLLEDTEPENIWLMKSIDINIFWLKVQQEKAYIKKWFLPYVSCRLLGSTSSLVEQPTQSILPETETLSLMFSTVIAWSLEGASLTRLRYTRSAPEIYPYWYVLEFVTCKF